MTKWTYALLGSNSFMNSFSRVPEVNIFESRAEARYDRKQVSSGDEVNGSNTVRSMKNANNNKSDFLRESHAIVFCPV
jgi:hypothetical protein